MPLKFNEIEKDSETTETTDSSRNEELEMLEEEEEKIEGDGWVLRLMRFVCIERCTALYVDRSSRNNSLFGALLLF